MATQITQAEREERVMRAIEFLVAFRVATAAQVYRAIYRKNPTGGTTWTKLMRKTEVDWVLFPVFYWVTGVTCD